MSESAPSSSGASVIMRTHEKPSVSASYALGEGACMYSATCAPLNLGLR